ncbi:MAG: hypothetical protein ACPGN3_17120 [Opitutales bacterium]
MDFQTSANKFAILRRWLVALILALAVTPCLWAIDLKPTFRGFVSGGILLQDGEQGLNEGEQHVELFEAALNASIFPFDKTLISGQVFVFHLGDDDDIDPKLDYLYLDHEVTQEFGLRAGRIRRKEGFFLETIDIDATRTFIRLPAGVYVLDLRDINTSIDGFSVYGTVDTENWGSFSYDLYGGDIDFDDQDVFDAISTIAFQSFEGTFTNPAIGLDTIYGGQLRWYSNFGLTLAYSYARYNDFSIRGDMSLAEGLPVQDYYSESSLSWHVLSSEYVMDDWVFRAEYLAGRSSDGRVFLDGVPPNSSGFGDSTNLDGWYVSAERFISDKLSIGTYYTEYYADSSDRDGSELVEDRLVSNMHNFRNLALGFSYQWRESTLLKMEAHWQQKLRIVGDSRNTLTERFPSSRVYDTTLGLAFKVTLSF